MLNWNHSYQPPFYSEQSRNLNLDVVVLFQKEHLYLGLLLHTMQSLTAFAIANLCSLCSVILRVSLRSLYAKSALPCKNYFNRIKKEVLLTSFWLFNFQSLKKVGTLSATFRFQMAEIMVGVNYFLSYASR